MALRRPRPHRRGPSAALVASILALAPLAIAAPALAQPKPPAGQKQPDLEIDPDKPPPPKEEPPLPPPKEGEWGVGGKEEEGKFAPQKKKVEEKEPEKPVDLGPPGQAGLDMVVGFGNIRDVTNDIDKTKATVASFVVGFRYRLFDTWNLGARFPISNGSITGPQAATSDDFKVSAIGNVELSANPHFKITERIRIPAELAVYLPTAQGDLFAPAAEQGAVAQALVNQAAAASRGWEDNPLFASKRLGVRLGGGVRYDTDALHFEAHTRIDVMGKIAGEDPKPDRYDPIIPREHTPNFTWSLGTSFFYDFFDGRLSPGLRTWVAYAKLPLSAQTRDYSGPVWVLEPDVATRWMLNEAKTLGIRGSVGFVIPVVGHLAGATSGSATGGAAIRGFRASAAFLF